MKKLIFAFALAAIVLSADPIYPQPGNPNPPYGDNGSLNPFQGDWISRWWMYMEQGLFTMF